MISHIQKWGNSQGLRFTKDILKKVPLETGDSVEISAKNGLITIKPAAPTRQKYKLENLIAEMPANYKTQKEHWKNPSGKEAW